MPRRRTSDGVIDSRPVKPENWETTANGDAATRIGKRNGPRQTADRMAKLEAPVRPGNSGTISAFEAYSRHELCSRTGLKTAAIRQAERQGLRAVTVGRLKFYLGCDFIDFLKALGAKQHKAQPSPQGLNIL